MGYGLILLIIVIALAGRHACSVGPSPLSQGLVVGLTAVLVFALLRWPGSALLIAPFLMGIGAYVVLHQIIMSWQRELAEAERASQRNAATQPHKQVFPPPLRGESREGS